MLAVVGLTLLVSTLAWDSPCSRPFLGWNSWNYFHCSVDASILMDTAAAMHSTGLAAAGYKYVNSDDCWMLAARDANGNQVANPEKCVLALNRVGSACIRAQLVWQAGRQPRAPRYQASIF